MIYIKSKKEIEQMRVPAEIMKQVLKEIENNIREGVTTAYLDYVAENVMLKNGAVPSFRGVPCPYRGGKTYTHATCISVNEDIIHGIPNERALKKGDVVSVDVGGKSQGSADNEASHRSSEISTYGILFVEDVWLKSPRSETSGFLFSKRNRYLATVLQRIHQSVIVIYGYTVDHSVPQFFVKFDGRSFKLGELGEHTANGDGLRYHSLTPFGEPFVLFFLRVEAVGEVIVTAAVFLLGDRSGGVLHHRLPYHLGE